MMKVKKREMTPINKQRKLRSSWGALKNPNLNKPKEINLVSRVMP
jgi:hypothetical protein